LPRSRTGEEAEAIKTELADKRAQVRKSLLLTRKQQRDLYLFLSAQRKERYAALSEQTAQARRAVRDEHAAPDWRGRSGGTGLRNRFSPERCARMRHKKDHNNEPETDMESLGKRLVLALVAVLAVMTVMGVVSWVLLRSGGYRQPEVGLFVSGSVFLLGLVGYISARAIKNLRWHEGLHGTAHWATRPEIEASGMLPKETDWRPTHLKITQFVPSDSLVNLVQIRKFFRRCSRAGLRTNARPYAYAGGSHSARHLRSLASLCSSNVM